MKKQVNKLFVLFVAILALGLLSFKQVHAEEAGTITFDFGKNNVELTDTLSIEVVNEEENSTIRIMDSGEELYQKNLSFVQVSSFHKVETENGNYGVITYRHDGSANGLYFEVIELSQKNAEPIFTSDVFERATITMIEDKVTIEYPDYNAEDSMIEPSTMLIQDFLIKGSSVEEGEVKSISLQSKKTKAKAQVNYKYKNPTPEEINRILTQKAIEADIPPEILKAIAFQESSYRQFWDTVPENIKKCKADGKKLSWDGTNALLAHDCIGIGIMQVSNHMYMSPGKTKDNYIQRLKEDIEFNIDEGIKILKEKWNLYRNGRIPTVNDNNPDVLDNWYFAILAYNGLLERNDPLKNPDTAYQERVFEHIRQYSQVDVTPFPTQILNPYYLSNGNLAFRSSNYQIPGPLQISSQSLVSGDVAYTTASNGLNLREGPGTNYRSITTLPAGTKVTINGNYRTNNTLTNHFLWFPVKTPLGEGWVSSGYLNLKEYVGIYSLAGSNRFETSVAIANYGWNRSGTHTVVIGRGDLPIDALTGSVLASGLDAPVLLTRNDRLTPAVKQELLRLQPEQVYILGGEGAISVNIENELNKLYKGVKVNRLDANNRYGTASKVAEVVASKNKVTEVFITSGDEKSSDPLAIAPYAGEKNIPILLTNTKKLSNEACNFITKNKISKVTIIGGKTAVSANVENELKKLVGKVERVSGKARFDTSLAIIDKYYNKNQLDDIFVAQGMDIADALSAAPLAAKKGSPLVLTLSDQVPESVNTWLKSNTPTKPDIYFLGGNNAIQNKVRNNIINLVK